MKFQLNHHMERYMIHLKNNGYRPIHSSDLVHRARELCSDMHASIRVARVANKFLEFDVSLNPVDLDLLIEKLSPIGELDNTRHVIEEKKEKELVQGIILLAVAFAHRQKDESNIGLGMLGRALEKLGDSPAVYGNIDIDRIRNKIKEMQTTKDLAIFEI